MPFKFFAIPARDPIESEAELNGFLRGRRVLSVERRLVEAGSDSFWALCVDYLDIPSGMRVEGRQGRGRIDYREVLPPDQFAVFARLRQWRQAVAKEEAVPAYAVFTNEQLARMVRDRCGSKADLEAIAGVGDARIEKYGTRVLELLNLAWSTSDAADGRPASTDSGP
jgi:superfamily II DNA helicase RecQ